MSHSLPCQVSAILFDLDDTIYDRDAAFRKWAAAFSQAYSPFSKQAAAVLVSLDAHGTLSRKELFQTFRRGYPALNDIETTIETYYQQFPDYIDNAPLLPCLKSLHDSQIPFGVVSNGYARQQQPKLAKLGIDRLTSCIFISEAFGKEKPDASIFQAAAACLAVPREQVLFIGDNPVNDIYGAHQTGMKTVWLQRFATWPGSISPACANIRVNSFDELAGFLNKSVILR